MTKIYDRFDLSESVAVIAGIALLVTISLSGVYLMKNLGAAMQNPRVQVAVDQALRLQGLEKEYTADYAYKLDFSIADITLLLDVVGSAKREVLPPRVATGTERSDRLQVLENRFNRIKTRYDLMGD